MLMYSPAISTSLSFNVQAFPVTGDIAGKRYTEIPFKKSCFQLKQCQIRLDATSVSAEYPET
jgi:hypothetical protein